MRHEEVHVKQAILATVVGVEKKSSDSVVVLLESDELREATEIVSTGLDCEQSRLNQRSRGGTRFGDE